MSLTPRVMQSNPKMSRESEDEVEQFLELVIAEYAKAIDQFTEAGIHDLPRGVSNLNFNDKTNDLRSYLFTRSKISTASYDAIKEQDQMEYADSRGFQSVGTGKCGEVFYYVNSGTVVKRAHSGQEDLWDDLLAHQSVYEVIRQARLSDSEFIVQVPKVFGYHPKTDAQWWKRNEANFISGSKERADVLITERILPIPIQIRAALIQAYCPPGPPGSPDLKANALKDKENKSCLIRLYLGRRRSTRLAQRTWRGLRDWEADLSFLEHLLIDVYDHATSMGIALACMHFGAKIDARGVEFVLGTGQSDPEVTSLDYQSLERGSSTYHTKDSKRRVVNIWLLDFNQCRDIEMTKDGMQLAARAFWESDPYYPRPVVKEHRDHRLWEKFELAYREKAKELGQDSLGLYFCVQIRSKATVPTEEEPVLRNLRGGAVVGGGGMSDPLQQGKNPLKRT